MTKYNIYSIPEEIRVPPYLNLLHRHTEGHDQDSFFEFLKFSWMQLTFSNLDKKNKHIVHIHWELNIYSSKYLIFAIIKTLVRIPALLIMKYKDIKIIWTKHNMSAHDSTYPLLDKLTNYLMWKLADAVIIQEKAFLNTNIGKKYISKIVYVPPGNYIGVYGSLWNGNRVTLRNKFGIKDDEIAILALGDIRPYKVLPKVITAVKQSCKNGARLRLIIAGKANLNYAKIIENEINKHESVSLMLGYVANDKIPEFFAMTDYSICFYDESALGSAAIMLSLSYGTPVITRDFPASELVIQGTSGYIFHDGGDLVNILTKLQKPNYENRQYIIDTVILQDWANAGKNLRRTYKELWKD